MQIGRVRYPALRTDNEIDAAIVSSLLFEEVLRKVRKANEPVQGLFEAIEKLKNLMRGFPTTYSLTKAIVNELSSFLIVAGRKVKVLGLEVKEIKELNYLLAKSKPRLRSQKKNSMTL